MNNVTYGNTTKPRPAKTKLTKTSSLASLLWGSQATARRANKINSNQIGFTEHGLVSCWAGYTQLWQCKYNLNWWWGGGFSLENTDILWLKSPPPRSVCYIVPTQYRNVTKTISKKGPLWTNNVVKIKLLNMKYELWNTNWTVKARQAEPGLDC